MSLLLTTVNTTTITELVDTDNAPAVFTHPVVDSNLLDKWGADDIRAATSLQTAIDNGDVTLTYNGSRIADITLFGLGAGRTYNAIRAITASETVSFSDEIVVYTGTGTATVTLPDPTGRFGESILIKNQTANDVTVATLAGNIDTFATITISGGVLAAVNFVSDGTNWLAV